MIPNLFIRLEAFPMTSSGKIARGVLAKYDISGTTLSLMNVDDMPLLVFQKQELVK